MLKFVLGRASSGKTFTVLNMIYKCVEEGKEPILIVPEQFSFESEKAILEMLGDSKAFKVSVLPFTRIYETIGRIKGGICGKVLSGADKFILMSRAIKQVEKDLSLWGKYASSSAFAEGMIRVTDEFKYNAVSAADLRTVADLQSDSKLVQKLNDTALIIDSYEMLLGTNFVDPSDFMDKLYYLLEDCDFFKGKEVFFDGVKSFSGQQFKIIDRILSKADNVTFSFVEDINDDRELSLLSNIRSIENRIISIAKSHNIEVDKPDYLSETHYNNEGLRAFEGCMFSGNFKSDVSIPCVTVCKAESIFDEVEFATRNIRRIIREKNAKYSDFVIIARDTAPYEDALLISCRRNKVKCFIDKKLPLVSMPVSSVVLSAISFALSGSVNDIFKFHKSGISVLTSDQISELENYVYIWNLSGRDFLRNWDMNTLGFTDKVAENDEEILTEINSLREKAITPLAEFKKIFDVSPLRNNEDIIRLLDSTSAKVHGFPAFATFERKSFIHELKKITRKLKNKKFAQEFTDASYRLPTSKDNVSAFIVKFSDQSNDKIGTNLLLSGMCSIDHLVAKKNGGPNKLANYGLSGVEINRQKTNIYFDDWVRSHPETRKNCQKQVDRLIELYKQGVFEKVSKKSKNKRLDKSYIEDFAKTIYDISPEESRIKLNISKLYE